MNDEKSKQVIQNYQEQEQMMILIYAQWCINNNIDPVTLYHQAYPNQHKNDALNKAITLTVAKEDADHIDDETIIQVLQLFGNNDLAFVVQNEIDKK